MTEWYLNRLVIYAALILFLFAMILLMYLEVGRVTKEHIETQKLCLSGFRYDYNSDQCIDIDECKEFKCQTCSNRVCQNILGGFECNDPKCPPAYRVHATFKKNHVNKCVRKRCKRSDIECHKIPKYKTIKVFHISPRMSGIVANELTIHEIFMRRFKEGANINVIGDDCVPVDSFELRHKERSVDVVLKNPLMIKKRCEISSDEILVKIQIVDRRTEKVYEIVDIGMKFFD